eukprot:jgi/Bigna1/75661/fgenesh1_pg.36_\
MQGAVLTESSTHFKHWIFSPAELLKKRQSLNQASVERVKQENAQAKKQQAIVVKTEDDSAGKKKKKKKRRKALTIEQEAKLLAFYVNQIYAVCSAYKFPFRMSATTLVFFKRFYISKSIMDLSPERILPAIFLLASKKFSFCGDIGRSGFKIAVVVLPALSKENVQAEECVIDTGKLAAFFNMKPRQFIRLEMDVLEGLAFNLKIYHAKRPIEGFINRIRSKRGEANNTSISQLEESIGCTTLQSYFIKVLLAMRGRGAVNFEGKNDKSNEINSTYFVYSYEHLDDEALIDACVPSPPSATTSSASSLSSSSSSWPQKRRRLLKQLDAVGVEIKRGEDLAVGYGKDETKNQLNQSALKILKRLQKCLNPLFNPESEEYKRLQREKKRKRDEEELVQNNPNNNINWFC